MPTDSPKKGKQSFFNKKIGGVKGKWWLVGGAGTAGVAWWYYRKSSSGSSASQAPSGVDPNTGAPYADEEAAYEQYQSGAADSYGSSGFGTGSAGGWATGGGGNTQIPTDPSGPVSDPTQPDPTQPDPTDPSQPAPGLPPRTSSSAVETNKDWQHLAILALEHKGYTAGQAKAAVAAYLAGLPLTEREEGVVQSAVRLVGPPPQGAPVVQHEPAKPPRSQQPPKSHGSGAAHQSHVPVRTMRPVVQHPARTRNRLPRIIPNRKGKK